MKPTVTIEAGIFNPVYLPHLTNTSRTQIFYGGAGSGKSVFLAQRCVYDVMHGGRNYLVCRAIARTVRRSVFQEIVKIINSWQVQALFTINHTDGMITCSNGYQILFTGLDDTEKVKSITPAKGAITDIWIEEATETERATIKQLYKRQRGGAGNTPKRLTMSFNPILQSHWIYEDYFSTLAWADNQTEYKTDELSILKTWYIHNRFLTDSDRGDLERETDPYFYSVYTLGNWGVLGNVIFTNWSVQDLSQMRDQFTNRLHGLDFGFSDDPAAVVQTHYHRARKIIYVFGELYETGLTNDLLAVEVYKMLGDDYVVCDSAEPKSIAELQKLGVHALSAKKGSDSVNHGIQWLQQQTIIIDSHCVNLKGEFMQYKWAEDKNGNVLRKPVDRNNHLIDALRYAYESESLQSDTAAIDDPFAAW